jgi:hypothetical protein
VPEPTGQAVDHTLAWVAPEQQRHHQQDRRRDEQRDGDARNGNERDRDQRDRKQPQRCPRAHTVGGHGRNIHPVRHGVQVHPDEWIYASQLAADLDLSGGNKSLAGMLDAEPTRGLEPRTPSLRVKCSTS